MQRTIGSSQEAVECGIGIEVLSVQQEILPVLGQGIPGDDPNEEGDSPDAEANGAENLLEGQVAAIVVVVELLVQGAGETEPAENPRVKRRVGVV